MTRQVQIVIPESALDDPRWGDMSTYDQRIVRLQTNDSTIVNIDGVNIQFPASWLKPVIHNP